MTDQWVSVSKAMELLELSRKTVHRLIERKKLVARRPGHEYKVSLKSIQERIRSNIENKEAVQPHRRNPPAEAG